MGQFNDKRVRSDNPGRGLAASPDTVLEALIFLGSLKSGWFGFLTSAGSS